MQHSESTRTIGPLAYVRFASEIALLVALAYVGAWSGQDLAESVLLAIGLPLAVAVVWGAFIAPRAKRRPTDPTRLVLEVALFGATAVALIGLGHWIFAVVLSALYAIGAPHGRAVT